MKLETITRNHNFESNEDFFETQDNTIDILYDNYFKIYHDLNNKSYLVDFSCGNMVILNRLKSLKPNINIFGSDIVKRTEYINTMQDMFNIEDILKNIIDKNVDVHIVMNPPFNKLTKILKYYLELKSKYSEIKSISILHSLRSLEGIQRHSILDKYGYPSLILNMTKRQSFNTYFNDEPNTWTPTFSCVWSIWDIYYDEITKFKYIK